MNHLWFKFFIARLVILWENLCRSFWPLLFWALLFLSFSFSGFASALGQKKFLFFNAISWHQISLLFFAVGGLFFAIKGLLSFRWPKNTDLISRLDHEAPSKHHPVATQYDQLPQGQDQTLWQEHQRRQQRELKNLKLPQPTPQAPQRDLYSLRIIPLLLICLVSALNWGSLKENLYTSLTPHDPRLSDIIVDAWITPPNYLKKTPIVLPVPDPSVPLELIEGSVLTLRVNSAPKAPDFKQTLLSSSGKSSSEFNAVLPLSKNDETNSYQFEKPLKALTKDSPETQQLSLTLGKRTLLEQRITLLKDLPPVVRFVYAPRSTALSSVQLRYFAEDDFGLKDLEALFELVETSDNRSLLRYNDKNFVLPLPANNSKERTVIENISAHPWAGQQITLRLKGTDNAAQNSESASVSFILPKRDFTHAGAKRLIEIRQNFLEKPDALPPIISELKAFLKDPKFFSSQAHTVLAVNESLEALAKFETKAAPLTNKNIYQISDMLWVIALDLEQGQLDQALEELEKQRRALQEAVDNNANSTTLKKRQEELEEALQALKDAYEAEAKNRALEQKEWETLQKENEAKDQGAPSEEENNPLNTKKALEEKESQEKNTDKKDSKKQTNEPNKNEEKDGKKSKKESESDQNQEPKAPNPDAPDFNPLEAPNKDKKQQGQKKKKKEEKDELFHNDEEAPYSQEDLDRLGQLQKLLEAIRKRTGLDEKEKSQALLEDLDSLLGDEEEQETFEGLPTPSKRALKLLSDILDIIDIQSFLFEKSALALDALGEDTPPKPQENCTLPRGVDLDPSALGQELLRRQLGNIMRQLYELDGEFPAPYGDAERSMKCAVADLQINGLAFKRQQDALEHLKKAWEKTNKAKGKGPKLPPLPFSSNGSGSGQKQSLSDFLKKRLQGRTGQWGESPPKPNFSKNEKTDPFGRLEGNNRFSQKDIETPEERSKESLSVEELTKRLRKKAESTDLSKKELEYLQRLLKRFSE